LTAVPYTPSQFPAAVVNPATGSIGAPPIPYVSVSEYTFAATAMATKSLNPGGTAQQNTQSLADTIRRASRWADAICFGADASSKGASLAASLSVETAKVRVLSGEIRLVCDYRPIVAVTGVDIGPDMSSLAGVDSSTAAQMRIGRRTLYVPCVPTWVSNGAWTPSPFGMTGWLTAVWSYVNGYPHTQLAQNVAASATSCVVAATDGSGGLWGTYPASGAFPGTALTVTDGAATESVFVAAIAANTPSAGFATLTTSPFANAHTVPAAPDFLPVSAIPADIHQAVISLTTMLIKTRGARAMVMPAVAGGSPAGSTKQSLAQAGALEDWDIASQLLRPYRSPSKQKT
jgi:hypothetical protein